MGLITELLSLTSQEIDRHFGLEVDSIEQDLYLRAKNLRPTGNLSNLGHVLHNGHQTWVGLDPQTLLTPYPELVQICKLLAPKSRESMIDLGAGYGRMGRSSVASIKFFPFFVWPTPEIMIFLVGAKRKRP